MKRNHRKFGNAAALKGMGHVPFPIGKPNSGYAQYFTGNSYLPILKTVVRP